MPAPIVAAPQSDLGERFSRLAKEWKEKSQFLSNTAQMALLRPYQGIIGMGWPVVPLILEELQSEPNQWFWALEAITEENPVTPEAQGNVRQMADAWIDWGKRRGLLS
jgi:hypothetical protein